jgi:hypothetical protein
MNLIKRITLLAFLGTFGSLYAQKPFFGFKVGTNVSKIVGLETQNKLKLGFHAGALAHFPLFQSKFSASQEINYTRRYFSAKRSNGEYIMGGLDYLDIPISLNFHITSKWYVNVGFQPSIYLYFKNTGPGEDSIRYSKSNVNPLDFGYLMGVGYLFQNNLLLGARLNGGVISLYDSINGPYYNMQFYVGYVLLASNRRSKFDDKPWYIEEN